MQTFLPDSLLATDAGQEADAILRACVHCGFCTATCPTYQVLGNELDSPRGRIYLIKSMLEGEPVSRTTRTHLDRCLTCQACETTCPSGVNYHRLLDIGRAEVERQVPRNPFARLFRWGLRQVLAYRARFTPLLLLGRTFRIFLPARLREQLHTGSPPIEVPGKVHSRKVILVQGCVQPGLSPNTNRAAALVLEKLGIESVTVRAEQCCGAMSYHLNAQDEGLEFARRNIDAWWPLVEEGVEAIVMTASGCSNFVQDYDKLLKNEPAYADKARRVVGLLRDISQLLADEPLEELALNDTGAISLHCPCTAQHGQKLEPKIRQVLSRLGMDVPEVKDSHLCCGSAGTYSMMQPKLATELRRRKLENLEASGPAHIVTANIGCQVHLAAGTETPVSHWIELVARALAEEGQ